MAQLARALLVTLGLSAAGALCGGLAGAAAMTLVLLVADGVAGIDRLFVVTATEAGVVLGAVLGPVTAWLALRRVALGTMLAGTSVGAGFGGVGGWAAGGPVLAVVGAVAGFLLAAIALRATGSLGAPQPARLVPRPSNVSLQLAARHASGRAPADARERSELPVRPPA